jgi:hypothetical protein
MEPELFEFCFDEHFAAITNHILMCSFILPNS